MTGGGAAGGVASLDCAGGVAEHGGSEGLGDAHQAGAVHLHDQVIHQDPEHRAEERLGDKTKEKRILCVSVCVCLYLCVCVWVCVRAPTSRLGVRPLRP